MTTVLASTGSTSCSYLDSKGSNHIFCAGSSGREYSADAYFINDMSAGNTHPTSAWREAHNTQSSRPKDPGSSSAPTPTNFISTSWSEDPSQLDPALAESIAFGFESITLPDTNLIDLGVSLDDFAPRIAEPRSPLSPAAAPAHSIGSQTRGYTLENDADRHQSQSPSFLYQALSAPQPQQHITHSRDLSTIFPPINRQQHLRQNTTVAESTGSDTPSSQDSGDDRLTEKRRRNKLAAQRLRQKKLDRISNLESKLEEVTKERNDLRLRLAKWEGEAMAMRQLFEQKMKE